MAKLAKWVAKLVRWVVKLMIKGGQVGKTDDQVW